MSLHQRWTTIELEPWVAETEKVCRSSYEYFLHAANQNTRDVFIFDFYKGDLKVRAKDNPYIVLREGDLEMIRLEHYIDMAALALKALPSDYQFSFALCVGDMVTYPSTHPIFGIQKSARSHVVLIPDPDFPNFKFYRDKITESPFDCKIDQVMFCGSSTGKLLSEEDVASDKSERLFLAQHFNGSEDVIFKIGAVVQCMSERAANLLRSKPYTQYIGWNTQLNYKYILSVDGNGATCSRVVNTLRSQSVLLKYKSDETLFYFDGLEPWRHYVPVDSPSDIIEKLHALRRRDIDAQSIIKNANEFYNKYLTEDAVIAYFSQLLRMFHECYISRLE